MRFGWFCGSEFVGKTITNEVDKGCDVPASIDCDSFFVENSKTIFSKVLNQMLNSSYTK